MPQYDRSDAGRESQRRILTELCNDLVYVYSLRPKREFVYVSASSIPITGYTPEEYYADPDMGCKLLHSDDRSMLDAIATGEEPPDEPLRLRCIHREGHRFWIEQRSRPVLDESGTVVGIEGVARDITERVLAERALRDNETQLRRINEMFSSLGTDAEENINTIVETTCEVFGATCSLYNVLGEKSESLVTWSGSHLPPDFQYTDAPEGHICYEATIKGGNRPVVIGDLSETDYPQTDPPLRHTTCAPTLDFP